MGGHGAPGRGLENSNYAPTVDACLKLIVGVALVALLSAGQAAPASAFTLGSPVVTSHSKTERNACFRGGYEQSGDAISVIDPAPCKAQRPRPEALPVHRAGLVRVRTAASADRVRITVRSRAGTQSLDALPGGDRKRRWRFRMPRFKDGSSLGIAIIYPDGRGSWTLPLKRHHHDPIYCPRTGPDPFDANRLRATRLERARAIARDHRCTVRVIKRDGRTLAITDDLRHNRINVVVNDRRVTRVDGVY